MSASPGTAAKKATAKKSNSAPIQDEGSFPIVAIGASAGGLEAITELLINLPPNIGMAFIYVQHLSPDHKSMLTAILSKSTKMQVQEIDDMDKIKPDNLFIIPHDKAIEVTDGHIKLIPRSSTSTAVTIDILLSSLAEAQKERVIGIILSGSGSDGTHGIKDVKHHGGLTYAQDSTAKFGSMPQSAIETGSIDYILSPREIALELGRLSQHPFSKSFDSKPNDKDMIDNGDPDLTSIFKLLLKVKGDDFSQYKMNTIKRRILRRMMLHKIETLKEYAQLLHEKQEEIEILYQDLLINVTSFFREPETHRYLKTTLFPALLKNKKEGESLRIWIPACSTGEEAYSIAMMLIELTENTTFKIPIHIFATDLSNQALSKARAGLFTLQNIEPVSPKRIQRFFTKTETGFRIIKAVRDMCVFAEHNILTDPPFSRLDFVSCCNLFIYLDIPAQKKAISTFHYALNEEGYLMLGKSETVAAAANLFSIFNKKYKIFIRKTKAGPRTLPVLSSHFPRMLMPVSAPPGSKLTEARTIHPKTVVPVQHLDKAIDDILISAFMPASVVINHEMEIQQFRGSTDMYLTHAPGKASFNILKMVRPEIAVDLRSAISQAIRGNERVSKHGVEIKLNGSTHLVGIEVLPLKIEWNEPLILILFSEQDQVEVIPAHDSNGNADDTAKDRRIQKLEQELAAVYSETLAYEQNQESFSAELQTANEEVVSNNEELQTLNEELETSKEEIESTNEELITTNQELQTRNDLLEESYKYSEAILSTIHEPIIILDQQLRVKSANNAFYKTFKVKQEGIEGLQLYDLGKGQWNIPRLRELLEDIIPRNSQFNDFEVSHTFSGIGKKVMILNAHRIVQESNREQLILLAIHDITEIRKKEAQIQLKEKKLLEKKDIELKAEKEFTETILQEQIDAERKISNSFKDADAYIRNVFMQAPVSVVVYKGPSFIVDMINDKGLEILGTTFEETINKPLFQINPGLCKMGMETLLTKVFTTGNPYIANEFPTEYKRDGKLQEGFSNFVLNPVRDFNGSIIGIAYISTDVTQEVEARKKIEESEKQFRQLADSMPQIAWTARPDGHIDYFNNQWYKFTGFEEVYGDKSIISILHPDDVQPSMERYYQSIETGEPYQMEYRFKDSKRPGRYLWFIGRANPVRDDQGNILKWFGTFTEIHEPKMQALEFEYAVKERTRELQQVNAELLEKNQEIALSKYNKRFLTEFSERFASNKAHHEFFNSLVLYIADLTKLDYVLVGKLHDNEDNTFSIQSVAIAAFGKLEENINYQLPNGPCEQIILGTVYSFPEKCQSKFPNNEMVVQFNIEGYIGYPLFNINGKAVGLIAVMHKSRIEDEQTVTSIIKITAKRAEIELERICYEATLEENNLALEEKNNELQKMNKELESFNYIASHDLQEPLRKIQLFAARIIQKEDLNLSEHGKDMFHRLQESAHRMQFLIQDLIAFSRISTTERKFECTDLNTIIAETKLEFKDVLDQKKATIDSEELCQIRAIPFLMVQLMENLIGNALKFSQTDVPLIIKIKTQVLTAFESPLKKETCHITVSDNGIGFHKDHGHKIFELFERLHPKDEYPGTGMGLAIVKKIVDNHNGLITATGEINKGASFDIYLPAN